MLKILYSFTIVLLTQLSTFIAMKGNIMKRILLQRDQFIWMGTDSSPSKKEFNVACQCLTLV